MWSLFLHISPYSSPIRTENAAKTLNCPFSYTKQNGVGCVLSNVITPSQRHNRTRRFCEQKHRQNGQSGPQRFLYNNAGLSLSIFKFRPMFKQHVNLLIWTWIFVHLTMGVNSYTNRYLCKNSPSPASDPQGYFVLFGLILYVTVKKFQSCQDGSSWVEPGSTMQWIKCLLRLELATLWSPV